MAGEAQGFMHACMQPCMCAGKLWTGGVCQGSPGGQQRTALSRTGRMAVCQSLQTTTASVPGEKGRLCSAASAALEKSRKRRWLSLKSRPLFCPYSFAPVLPQTCPNSARPCHVTCCLYKQQLRPLLARSLPSISCPSLLTMSKV